MATKVLAGITVEVTDEGYLTDATKWTPEIATELAKEEGITLSQKHMDVLNYIREKALKGETLTIRAIGKSGIVDIKGFYELFPGAPLKLASKIAGISKPSSCV
ncbi:MAG TPA: TusE/DsrC/DsvC family sulfur relay protein [Bacteroidales bacterium]|jgi:tRNA 2-thiouridine synthesizing protein E|nr:TusE/DsrC/DsvC family sulfur relay protein [Bacteroidales bacterium]HNV96294.1 TusE/DsrC/DsvC family sulfur relay protein [Bacteroidales bacterium]